MTADMRGPVQAIGRSEPLLITHRLDGCTEGLLVLGKTKAFVQRFNPLLATAGGLRKTYRALSHTPLQPGEWSAMTTSVHDWVAQMLRLCDLGAHMQGRWCTSSAYGSGSRATQRTRWCTKESHRAACAASWKCFLPSGCDLCMRLQATARGRQTRLVGD